MTLLSITEHRVGDSVRFFHALFHLIFNQLYDLETKTIPLPFSTRETWRLRKVKALGEGHLFS